ncbi:MAG: class II fumarate hydratase [Myxococcales bacterium]|nr:class II fumarate hydratase [Myxococcales bacterium]USN49987.1 MAG: class II fumarate hydratase [Myxococcales bacterium]
MEYRVDQDSMGKVNVPKNAYYGAQTARSLENFPIGNELMPKTFIRALAITKQAAALANNKLGRLSEEITLLIVRASSEIIDGKLSEQFPLKIWQTGSGTQTNMNMNEVIAHRANEFAGKELGAKSPVHPNDHVNLSQSTNDIFPTAMHVSAAMEVKFNLLKSINQLATTFEHKSKDFKDIVKMGRTHLQDATPISLGQEMSGYAAQLRMCEKALQETLPFIYQLAAGGTAVGTGLNAHHDFAKTIASIIAHKTGLAFESAPNKFCAMAAHDSCALLSGVLNTLACAFMKIANDIRWMASGPRGGIGEIFIAENEPGSSIMPGKVNPTQSEAATMVACQVMGNHTAISIACSQGNFELNVFKPVIMKNLLNSIELLSDSLKCFDEKCAQSIQPNMARINELKNRSLMLVTALTPYIGYDQAALVAKTAHKENKTLKEVCLDMNLMSEKEFDERVRPENMIQPSF